MTAHGPWPSLGRIVLVPMDPERNNGATVAPAVITRVHTETVVNVRILADTDATLGQWRQSCVLVPTTSDMSPGSAYEWTWPWRLGASI